MKLGPVLSFTTEKIIYIKFSGDFSWFMNNVQTLESDTLGPRTGFWWHCWWLSMAHMADNMTQDLWDASVFVEWQLKAEGYCKPQKVYVHAIKSHQQV